VTGLFETMLALGGRIVQLEEHAARMARSCRALGLGPLDEAAFREAAYAVVRNDESAVRVTLVGGVLEATAFAIPEATRLRRMHGRAITLPPSVARSLPEHKLLPYTICSDALRDAVAAGADEALFVTRDGGILEGTGTNVFAVRGDVLITAADGVLPGIVRAWVLATAPTLGLQIEERPPHADELRDGGFFTGSLTTLAPIRVLDGQACAPPGDAYAELARRYPL
jgi:branched-chain amino acid aminotransferase